MEKKKQQSCYTFLLGLFLVFCVNTIHAQIIKGKITRDGEAVSMINIQTKKQQFISTSDVNGQFVIGANAGDDLVIRQGDSIWIVQAVQDIQIELNELSRNTKTKTKQKQEVIPVNYSNNWGDSLGTISRFSHTEFNQGNIFDPYELIEGRVPGLTASRPGGDPLAQFDVQMRGLHTFNNYSPNVVFETSRLDEAIDRTRPLLVIDGLPSASLLGVDPASISSITVLRDAASAAAYGLRGANGVIEIETKFDGDNSDKPFTLTYNTALVQDSPTNMPDVLTADEYRFRITGPNQGPSRGGIDLGENTDWQRLITRTAWSHTHHLNIGGAAAQTKYRVSLNYRDQDGIGKNSGFNRLNGQVRLQQQLWKNRIKLGLKAGYTKQRSQDIDPLAFRQASIYNPTAPIYSETLSQYGGYHQSDYFHYHNPVAMIEQTTRDGTNKVGTLGTNFKMTPFDGLEINGAYTIQQNDNLYGVVYPRNAFFGGVHWSGRAEQRHHKLDNQYGELGFSYQQKRGEHRFRIEGGYNYQQWDYRFETVKAYEFSRNDFSYDDIEGAAKIEEVRLRSRDVQKAFWGQMNYDWKSTLFFKVHLRQEGASRLGPENKWALFPALQGALSLHKVLDLNNRFHFRMAYGEVGQLPAKNYAAHYKVAQRGYMYYQGEYVSAYSFINTPNPMIGEERRREWNMGFDFGILRNRFMLQLDWYSSITKGIGAETILPSPPNPVASFYDNFGVLRNRGLEIAVSGKVLQGNRLDWNTSLQLFTNKTTLVSLTNPKAQSPFETRKIGAMGFPGLCCTRVQRLQEGEPIGSFYAQVYQGVDAEGRWIFSKSSTFSDHSKKVGNAQPNWQLGWKNDLKLGRFDLSFLLSGSLGHDLVNTHRVFYGAPTQMGAYNVLSSAFEGDISRLTDYPEWSSYYLENASFIRLEYLSVGYDIQLQNAAITGLRLYLAAQDLFTITGYSGTDPSLRLDNGGNPLAPGIEVPNGSSRRGNYFPNKTLMLGLRLQL